MAIETLQIAFDINPTQLGLEFGTGAVIGGIIGFAAKKVAKVIAVIVGLELVLLKFLESRNIVEVDWSKLGAAFLEAGEVAGEQDPSLVMSLLSTASIGAGFGGGFYLGFKRG